MNPTPPQFDETDRTGVAGFMDDAPRPPELPVVSMAVCASGLVAFLIGVLLVVLLPG